MGRGSVASFAILCIALVTACGRPQVSDVGPELPSGPVVTALGTRFTLWAPHASKVFLEGDFNGWSTTATPLAANGDGTFSVEVAGIGDGTRYRYLLVTSSGSLVRNDPRAMRVEPDLSASIVYDQGAFHWTDGGFTAPPESSQVVYEMHVSTWNDPSGTGAGTWAAAQTKLDHLAAVGVNMVEVLPPVQFPGAYSWGYNPIFPFAPETNYGTPDDVKRFVDAAHARGIGVIVDIVHNHWGPDDLPMWCFDGACLGNGNGGIYFYTGARRETGFGPRPDYGRAQVRNYIADNSMMWLRDYHADGLRWDSVVNIRRANNADLPDGWALLQRVNDDAHTKASGKIMIAEDLQNYDAITRATAQGGAGFDSQWDPSFFYPLKSALVTTNDADRDMNAVAGAISHGYNGQATQRVIFTENHDQVAPQNGADNRRIPALVSPADPGDYYAQKRATLGAAVMLTSPGIPMLFMGQEFLESLPFPFGPAQAIDWSKETTFAGIQKLFHRLILLRKNGAQNTRGLMGNHTHVFHVNNAAKVIAWHRWDQGGPGDDVVVVANFSTVAFQNYVVGFPRSGTWHVRFNGDWTGYSPLFDDTPSNDVNAGGPARDGLPFSGAVGVGPYSVVILSQ
ncbi:MAG TPA: alpha-amylase family glycosyl hydrolase [bacterium]|nr:alpha-amylase family glycosyl hydrolase [bacterium]